MIPNRLLKKWMQAVAILIVLAVTPGICRAFKIEGPDIEKPKPEFTRSGDRISAKYIPRAKSTSVEVNFKADGGRLAEVGTYDWEKAERPEVDVKNFKSSLFTVHVEGMPPGGEAKVSLISEFFISSTRFFIFNPALPAPWIKDGPVQNISLGNRVQELIITVKDGGPLDSDGAADGRITLIGGPRDSFWGYALGTLFIRFFGIFIVLIVLMIGMLVSGLVFKSIEARQERAAPVPPVTAAADEVPAAPRKDEGPSNETVSAIAAALSLHFSRLRGTPGGGGLVCAEPNAWTQQGRQRLMNVRSLPFRNHKS